MARFFVDNFRGGKIFSYSYNKGGLCVNYSRRILFGVLVALMTFALLTGGCGGSSSDGGSGTTSENASTENGGSTQNDDGSGRNVDGIEEQSLFTTLSRRWVCSSVQMRVRTDVYIDAAYYGDQGVVDPQYRFITEYFDLYDEGTLEIAPFDSDPNTTNFITGPVTRDFISTTTGKRANNIAIMKGGTFTKVNDTTFMAMDPENPGCYQMIIIDTTSKRLADGSYSWIEYQYVHADDSNSEYSSYSVVMKLQNQRNDTVEEDTDFKEISSRYVVLPSTKLTDSSGNQYSVTDFMKDYRLIAKGDTLNIADKNSASDTTDFITEPITLNFRGYDSSQQRQSMTVPVLQTGKFKKLGESPLIYQSESEDGNVIQQIFLEDSEKFPTGGWERIRVVYIHTANNTDGLPTYTVELMLYNEGE